MKKELKLSVVIVNYNVKYFLELCLSSVYRSVRKLAGEYYPFCAEIWVVDNNSTDGSIDMVRAKFPEVRIIANTQNKGFSFANNQAINQTEAEYILLLNPDTVVGENSFASMLHFMDEHPEAGGLGIKMIDGKGNFLPESKRGLPTPEVAFYKVSGLSALFPKTKIFGRYHLGFLSKNKDHKIEVLSGAAMLLRKSALAVSGNLDEDFFMYGEDIDLSYRITKAGFKNYYYAGTSIIHYKGESTKKSSINYVFVFYKAMIIFARKHFAKKNANLFAFLINFAVYLRAGAALVYRLVKMLLLPIADGLVLYGVMLLLVSYWEHTIKYIHGGKYPPELTDIFIPVYIVCWVMGLFFAKGYQKPYFGRKLIIGPIWGGLIISLIYAFLDERYRNTRAIIILGTALAVIVFSINRIVLRFIKNRKNFIADANAVKKILIVGNADEAGRISGLMDKAEIKYNNIGLVSPGEKETGNAIGTISGLEKLIRIYKIDEVIFCARDIPYQLIISEMEQLHKAGVSFKIVSEDSDFIIGSNSKNENGDFYARNEELLAIEKRDSRLNKRGFDIAFGFALLITLPFNIWFVKQPSRYIRNIFMVLSGKYSWVGYSNEQAKLPPIKKGVFSPADELKIDDLDTKTIDRLDYLYAKDYTIFKDLSVVLSSFAKIGNVPE